MTLCCGRERCTLDHQCAPRDRPSSGEAATRKVGSKRVGQPSNSARFPVKTTLETARRPEFLDSIGSWLKAVQI
jgi:hypothetical protein